VNYRPELDKILPAQVKLSDVVLEEYEQCISDYALVCPPQGDAKQPNLYYDSDCVS
jgi:hypothetical protein